jgi:threonyl-tRNA synthetase
LKLAPYMFVVGERDAEAGTVAVRDRIDGDLGAMPVEAAIAKLKHEVDEKTVRQVHRAAALPVPAGGEGDQNEY